MNVFRTVKTTGVLVLLVVFSCTFAQAQEQMFPMPDAIAPNVAFWTKVYAQYTTSQGIVHDSWDMDRIYDIIPLLPYDAPGATKINRKRMKRAQKKYTQILHRLSKNPHTTDTTSRRVAALFESTGDARQFSVAASRVRCQIGQKDRFQAGLIRSGAYLGQIQEIFAAQGLPTDLAYLPHVESSFNPNAYSKFGAAGVWQFTRSTGKRFMNVGYELDERRDPILATHAAAALLKENYEKLGSWPLAITAYNHGAAGMQRAREKHGDFAEIYQHYRGRTFKFASRNFYSEFLAARHVATHAEDYFGDLALHRPAPTHVITLAGYARFDDLSDHFGVDSATLQKMNPALRRPVLEGQKYVPKGYALRLPAERESQLLAAIPDDLYKTVQKRSRFYTVQRGDTAGRVARMHNVNLSDLILANNLNHRATIYPRQTLRIPGADEPRHHTPTPAQQPEPSAVAKTETPKTEVVTIAAATDALVSPPAQPRAFPQPVLASVIPLSVSDSKLPDSVESTDADQLQVGNEQVVAVDVGVQRTTMINGRPVGQIQVAVEETLGHYAEWANVRTQQIRRLNGLQFGAPLHLHQKINIPLHRVDAQTFEQNRYEFHKRLQEDFFAVYRIGELQTYRVERGDNYWTLCRDKFQIPMWLLKHCNPETDLADLRYHQKLIIPAIEKASMDDANPGMEQESDTEEVEPSSEPETSKQAVEKKTRSL